MVSRFRAWLRYRRYLTAVLDDVTRHGYNLSPPTWERVKAEARAKAKGDTP